MRCPNILRKQLPFALAVCCFSLAAMFSACQRSDTKAASERQGRRAADFPVELAPVEARQVDYTIQSVGTLLAQEEVQITSRVSGVVERVRFIEGAHVQKGAILAEIEPERWRIAVASAKASLDRSKAATHEARLAFQRREKLSKNSPGLISAEEVELYGSKFKVALAEEALAQAAFELAELNLRDAYVRAPIDGIVERRMVQTGLYTQPGTVLATMIRRSPLLLETDVSTDEAAQLEGGMKLTFSTGSTESLEARIIHIGQAANPRSRRVRLLAEVDAMGQGQRPGDFVKVQIPVGNRSAAPVVAQMAIRPSEKGFLAYVIENGVARERIVSLGLRTQDGFVEIRDGIDAGESVVVRGNEPLFDGARIRIIDAADPSTPTKALPTKGTSTERAGQAT
ncbi:MAG: efflux RND transporter periplasmic adaptor subunit [Myxococcales bacterium]|jgi:multidrug efflux system membrane fusion protein|nr:efflux RND transporter periplasmic adaptor subunit [Myxococcales bacterium]